MIWTLILERDRKAYNVVRRETERRKGTKDGVFYIQDDQNSKFEQYVLLLFSKTVENQWVKCVRILQIHQSKCIIYPTQNAHKIVDFFSENGTWKDWNGTSLR